MSYQGFAVVNESDAKKEPYPYVYVEDSGEYRELDDAEKGYLEEKFHPADGGRPYIKSSHYSTNPDSSLSGFVKRAKLSKKLKIEEIFPPKPWWRFW